MTQYNNVKLSDSQLDQSKSATKNGLSLTCRKFKTINKYDW